MLAVVSDGWPEPAAATSRFRLLEPQVGAVIRVPFVPGLRLADDPATVRCPAAALPGPGTRSRPPTGALPAPPLTPHGDLTMPCSSSRWPHASLASRGHAPPCPARPGGGRAQPGPAGAAGPGRRT